jgi:hypothetical protein
LAQLFVIARSWTGANGGEQRCVGPGLMIEQFAEQGKH